jgi:hypothetical protein
MKEILDSQGDVVLIPLLRVLPVILYGTQKGKTGNRGVHPTPFFAITLALSFANKARRPTFPNPTLLALTDHPASCLSSRLRLMPVRRPFSFRLA